MGLEAHEDFGRVVGEYGGTLEDILEHYGIRGMKWGVRRSRTQIDNSPDSPEHTRARELHAKAKTSGTRKLTNKDLQDLNARLNLEQNFANLNAKTKQKNAVATGAAWTGKKIGKFGDMALDTIVRSHMQVELHKRGLLAVAPVQPGVK